MTLGRLVALIAIVLVAAACSSVEASGGQLGGSDWVLRAYEQDGDLTIMPETLYADAEVGSQRVRGFSGCNTYDALYRSGGRMLLVSQVAVTRMACPEEAMVFESTYLSLLEESRFYTVRRGVLTVLGADGRTLLEFDAAPRNPLRGSWRVESFAVDDSTVAAPLAGTRLDVVFGIASVGGSSGCNSFSGAYGTNGNVVRIGRLATTRMACDEAVMAQESAFLDALQGAAVVDTRGPRVDLTDLKGRVIVALVRPSTDEDASPSPSSSPEASPSASPEASPTPSTSPEPSTSPSPTPAPSPSSAPTPLPTPPIELPTVGTCQPQVEGTPLATIVYPASWSTVTEPAGLACRYFDPEPIEVPTDPATLVTAVMVTDTTEAYADVVTTMTDPASWQVRQQVELTVGESPATLVEAESTSDASGLPAGTSSFAYVIDVGPAGTIMVRTTGTAGDDAYAARAAVVTFMTGLSIFASAG